MGNASTLRDASTKGRPATSAEATAAKEGRPLPNVRIDGGITAPLGFTSAALHCGIKAKSGALDLTVVSAAQPVAAAGLFTTNLAQAAPVLISKRNLQQTAG